MQIWNDEGLKARFWGKVDVGEDNECWEWTGSCSHGYGGFYAASRKIQAHRVSWVIHTRADIPKGTEVCHTCDNRPCVNPKHLFLGTRRDNVLDCLHKGRLSIGEKSGSAKLSDDDVDLIEFLKLMVDGITYRTLADMFGVSEKHIGRIIRGELRCIRTYGV